MDRPVDCSPAHHQQLFDRRFGRQREDRRLRQARPLMLERRLEVQRVSRFLALNVRDAGSATAHALRTRFAARRIGAAATRRLRTRPYGTSASAGRECQPC
eukprot:2791045-Pleurochrysis_carterae.AAC.1